MSARLVVISGCSGGGKSTLIDELARRGHATVPEVGRRLLHEELARGGAALPWVDPDAFLARMVEASLADLDAAAGATGTMFFDRSLLDALSGQQHRTGAPIAAHADALARYDRTVFFAPPWPAIYVQDDERRHDLAAAEREYHRLLRDYPAAGFHLVELPRTDVAARADAVLAALA